MTSSPYVQLSSRLSQDEKTLLLEFFITFSRFEYAMKESGKYIKANGAEADWDGFQNAMRTPVPQDPASDAETRAAMDFILSHPPKKQVPGPNGGLSWTNTNDVGRHEQELLGIYVRRIRNNLFHGGKDLLMADGMCHRDLELVRSALSVLRWWLASDADLSSSFAVP